MPELTDAQKVMRNDTGKRMADALEALAGTGGRGLPAGGTDGDVLVKNGATDYAANWTNTPKQMGSLAYINATSAAERTYGKNEFLVYNGQLYKAAETISQDVPLTPGSNILLSSALSAQYYNDTGIEGVYGKTFSGLGMLYGSFNGSFNLPAYSTVSIASTLRQELRPSVDTGRAVWMGRDNNSNVVPVGIIIRASGEITAYNMSGAALQLSSITGTSAYLL